MVQPILQILQAFRKQAISKQLTIRVLTIIAKDNDLNSPEWAGIYQQIAEHFRGQLLGFYDRDYLELPRDLQMRKLLLENDQCFTDPRIMPSILLEMDQASQLLCRKYNLMLLGDNINYAITEVKGNDLRQLDLQKVVNKMRQITERVEWNLR